MALERHSKMYTCEASSYAEAYPIICPQMIQDIFGTTQITENLQVSYIESTGRLILKNTVTNKNVCLSNSFGSYSIINGICTNQITWVTADNFIYFDGLWLWKGKFTTTDYGSTFKIMDYDTMQEWGIGKIPGTSNGMIAYSPLYDENGNVLEDAYNLNGNGISNNCFYNVGGHTFFAVISESVYIFIALK